MLKKLINLLEVRNLLEKNSVFSKKYENQRCFIIGNGPSLSLNDVKLLKNEYTFTVNSMTETNYFDILQPNFHVMVDSTRFSDDYPQFKSNLLKLSEKDFQTSYIFPIKSHKFCNSIGVSDKLNILYVKQGKLNNGKIKRIDLTKPLPPYKNVLNTALYSAIFMGFSKIYLLGFDMTGFIHTYTDGDMSYGGHFYDGELKSEVKTMDLIQKSRPNEYMLKSYSYVFELLRLTNDFAKKNNIEIVNCSRTSTIDTFDFNKLESIINHEKSI